MSADVRCHAAGGALALAALFLLVGPPAATAIAPQRVLVQTGDAIAGRTLGTFAAVGLDIDAAGRVLIGSALGDGSQLVAWADDDGIHPLWRSATGGPYIQADTARASDDGEHVLALAEPLPYDGGSLPYAAVFALTGNGARRLLGAGDVTLDGWEVVAVRQVGGVADDGSAALLASVRSAAGESYDVRALIALTDAGARVVAGNSERLPAERRFYVSPLAALAGGAVVFDAASTTSDGALDGIYRADADTIVATLTIGDPHPDGGTVGYLTAHAANGAGDVLARICRPDPPLDPFGTPDCPIYRSQGDGWVRVRDGITAAPDGRRITVGGGALNRRGDVMLGATLYRTRDGELLSDYEGAAVYHPARGSAQLIDVAPGYGRDRLNDRGEAVFSPLDTSVVRWSTSGRRELVGRDARTTDGIALIGGGLGFNTCLADDGRVAAQVAHTDGSDAWVCIDDDGPHALPQPAAVGEGGSRCAFAGEELAVLAAGAVSRIDGRRATTVLRRGDRLPDGSRVGVIDDLAANAAGTLVAVVSLPSGVAIVRQPRGGDWETVDLAVDGASAPTRIDRVDLTPGGRIVALTDYGDPLGRDRRVLVVDGGGVRALAVPDGRGDVFSVQVRDELALVWTTRWVFGNPADLESAFTVFDVGTSAILGELGDDDFTGADGALTPIGIGRDASILFSESTGFAFDGFHWLADGGAPRRLATPDAAVYGLAVPIDLITADEVLYRSLRSAAGASHHALSTSATHIDGVCPAAETGGGGAGGDGGCQIDRGSGGAWPLAIGLAAWAVVRRRGRAGARPSRV